MISLVRACLLVIGVVSIANGVDLAGGERYLAIGLGAACLSAFALLLED